MEGDDREPAAGTKKPLGSGEATQELAELIVDRDAEGLEGSRRRMCLLPPSRRGDAGDHPGELKGRDEGRRLAVFDDGAGDAARGALLAEMEEHIGDCRLVLVAQNVSGGPTLASHAHVERRVETQREAALGLIELHRRDADVENDAVDRRDAEFPYDRVEVAEPRLDDAEPAAGKRDEAGAGANGRRVAVERDDARASVDQRARIAAGAEGSVDHDSALARPKRLESFGKQNRDVAPRLAHAGASALRSALSRRTRLRASSRWAAKRDGSQIWNLCPCPTNAASSRSPSDVFSRSSSDTRPSASMRRTSLVPNKAVAKASRSGE